MKKYLIACLVTCFCGMNVFVHAQKANWQNLDLSKDSVFGISTEKAYTQLLSGKKATPLVVAVIDGGIDTTHEDLVKILWSKKGEGTHGWSYIGSPKGNIEFENMEVTRMLREMRQKGDTLGQTYSEVKNDYDKEWEKAEMTIRGISGFRNVLNAMLIGLGNQNPSAEELKAYRPKSRGEEQVVQILLTQIEGGMDVATFRKEQIDGGIKHFRERLDYHLNLNYNPRGVVGDNPQDAKEKNYGSADVMGPDADHGSHVSGIIAADRNNDIGIKGVADHVQVMALRVVPNGDERDKDIANAIRFAVDNGARVINMSFGKPFSPDKKVVDEAVRYAVSKDVLLVHSAGNDNKDLDQEKSFPTRVYADGGGVAAAWIEVGASGPKNDSTLAASFSNYGKTTVDVFAPGVGINSTVPGSKYALHEGTSMAAPVVTGLAALIREYYPKLSALQVKDVIMRSVIKSEYLTGKCISGGVVNAYAALQLAGKM